MSSDCLVPTVAHVHWGTLKYMHTHTCTHVVAQPSPSPRGSCVVSWHAIMLIVSLYVY